MLLLCSSVTWIVTDFKGALRFHIDSVDSYLGLYSKTETLWLAKVTLQFCTSLNRPFLFYSVMCMTLIIPVYLQWSFAVFQDQACLVVFLLLSTFALFFIDVIGVKTMSINSVQQIHSRLNCLASVALKQSIWSYEYMFLRYKCFVRFSMIVNKTIFLHPNWPLLFSQTERLPCIPGLSPCNWEWRCLKCNWSVWSLPFDYIYICYWNNESKICHFLWWFRGWLW